MKRVLQLFAAICTICTINSQLNAARRIRIEQTEQNTTHQDKATQAIDTNISIDSQIENKKAQLKNTIRNLSGTQPIIQSIQSTQEKIRRLEEEHGIPRLQQKVDRLRYQACVAQQENETIQKKLQQAEQIKATIDNITQEEQQKINNLNTQLEQATSEEKQQELQNNIETVQKEIKEKPEVQQQISRIEAINKEIYQHPDIAKLLEQAQQPAQDLHKRYHKIQDELDNLEQQLNNQVNKLQKRIAKDFDAIQPIIDEIHDLQDKIEDTQSCRKPERGIPSWENLLL